MSTRRNRIPRNLPRGSQPNGFRRVALFVFGTAGLTTLSVFVIGLFVFTATFVGPALKSAQLAAVISATLVDLTNQDRVNSQLNGLTLNPVLTAAAQAKANDMATNGYFAHVSPAGLNSWYWFKQAGYNFSYAGENLAVDFTDSSAVNQAWLNSPTHRANIMNDHFTQIGIATAQGMYEGHQTTFVVQMFGTPSDMVDVSEPVQTVTSPTIPTDIALATTKLTQPKLSSEVLGTTSQSVSTKPNVQTQTVATSEPAAVTNTVPSDPPQVAPPSSQVLPQRYAPFWGFIVTSPKTVLQTIYLILAAFLIITLIIRTGLEIRMHHVKHVYEAILLLLLMGLLFYAANYFIFVQPIIGVAQQISTQ